MRKPSSNIHELIDSLTKEEKKRITIHLNGLGKKGKEHLRLFRAIGKQKEYDEDALKKLFRGIPLSIAKKRLYDLIIAVLIQLNSNLDIHHELLTGLQRIRTLFQKDLYQQTKEEAFRLRKLAEENDQFDYLPLICKTIIHLESVVYQFSDYDNVSLNRFLKKTRTYGAYSFNIMEYVLLKAEIFFYTRRKVLHKEDKLEVEKIIKNPLLKSLDRATTGVAKLHFYQIHLIYAGLVNDAQKAYDYAFEALDFFEKNGYSTDSPEWYLMHLINASNNAIYCKRRKEIIEVFDKMDKAIQRVKKNKVYYKLKLIEVKANWCVQIGDLEMGKELIANYAAYLNLCSMDTSIQYFLFAFIAFLDESYDQTLIFVEKIIDKETNKQYENLRLIGNVFKLLIYFELDEFSLLESQNRSLYRTFQKDKNNYKVGLVIVHLFRKILKSSKKEQKRALEDFKKELIILKAEMTTSEATLVNCLSLMDWVNSHLEKRSLVNVVRAQVFES